MNPLILPQPRAFSEDISNELQSTLSHHCISHTQVMYHKNTQSNSPSVSPVNIIFKLSRMCLLVPFYMNSSKSSRLLHGQTQIIACSLSFSICWYKCVGYDTVMMIIMKLVNTTDNMVKLQQEIQECVWPTWYIYIYWLARFVGREKPTWG